MKYYFQNLHHRYPKQYPEFEKIGKNWKNF